MQTFLTSHFGFLRSHSRALIQYGFTLVELLIVVSIIALISSVILVRFVDFDSSTILRNLAFEVATAVREAQVVSLGSRGESGGPDFDVPYGVTFTSNSKEYTLFSYGANIVPPATPDFTDGNANPINTTFIGRSLEISELCIKESASPSEDCSIGRLDISFLRPEFNSLFNTDDASIDNSIIEYAKVKVKSTVGGNVWVVEVGKLGNISVVKE